MIAQYEQARQVWQSLFSVEFNGDDDSDVLEAIAHDDVLRSFAFRLIAMRDQLPQDYESRVTTSRGLGSNGTETYGNDGG